jgi:hypothetical protein
MAGRPRKLTVTYFPHYCTHKKTLFILQQNFGNDGYAFWFKLLEQLGVANGHFIDLRNNGTSEFLYAYTGVNEITATNILNMLSKLHAIDEELWQIRVIWCQNFVEGVAEVYSRREADLPKRPEHLLFSVDNNGISVDNNSQDNN